MTRLLNERTGTVHKPRQGTGDGTACGALRHVPRHNITPVGDAEHRADGETERCGRCFEDAGGY